MGRLAIMPSSVNDRDRIEEMLLALQSGRVAFVGAVMRLRYTADTGHARVLRRVVVAYLRLQRLSEAAAELLDATTDLSM
jgi:hypothetical protein